MWPRSRNCPTPDTGNRLAHSLQIGIACRDTTIPCVTFPSQHHPRHTRHVTRPWTQYTGTAPSAGIRSRTTHAPLGTLTDPPPAPTGR